MDLFPPTSLDRRKDKLTFLIKQCYQNFVPDLSSCGIIPLFHHSTRVSTAPTIRRTKTAVIGTSHNIGTATSLQRGQAGIPDLVTLEGSSITDIMTCVPMAAVRVFSTPDDGCCDTRNM